MIAHKYMVCFENWMHMIMYNILVTHTHIHTHTHTRTQTCNESRGLSIYNVNENSVHIRWIAHYSVNLYMHICIYTELHESFESEIDNLGRKNYYIWLTFCIMDELVVICGYVQLYPLHSCVLKEGVGGSWWKGEDGVFVVYICI